MVIYSHCTHVLHIINSLSLGGAEYGVVVNLVNSLDSSRLNCSILSLSFVDSQIEKRVNSGHSVYCIPKNKRRLYPVIREIDQLVKRNRIAIIHTHNWATYFFGFCAALLNPKIKLIHTEHGRDEAQMVLPFKRFALQKLFLLRTEKLVAVSKDIESSLLVKWRAPRKKTMVVENGVDTNRFNPERYDRQAFRAHLGIIEDAVVLGTVSVLREVKNHPLLLQAMHLLILEGYNLHLIVVGDAPQGKRKEILQQKAEQLGIQHKVFFLGARTDTPELMACMDIYVNMSLFEGMSITVLEAMASALPVIASNVGGNPELVEDGVTGALFTSNDVRELVHGIRSLLNEPGLMKTMGSNGRRKIIERYSLDRVAQQYAALYCPIKAG